jgi:hypothetical protein
MKQRIVAIALVCLAGALIGCLKNNGSGNDQNDPFQSNKERFESLKQESPKLYDFVFKQVLKDKAIANFEDAVHFWGQPTAEKQKEVTELGGSYTVTISSYDGFNIVHNKTADGTSPISKIQLTSNNQYGVHLGDQKEKVETVLGKPSSVRNGQSTYSTEEIVAYLDYDQKDVLQSMTILLDGR